MQINYWECIIEGVQFATDIDSLEGKAATITGWGKFGENLNIAINIVTTGAATGRLLVAETPINNMGCKEEEDLKRYFNSSIHVCAGSEECKYLVIHIYSCIQIKPHPSHFME